MPKHKLWKHRNGVYYAWILGERVSTGCRDEKAAQRQADQLERAAVDPGYKAAHSAKFGEACQTFREELELRVKAGKRSPKTVEFYSYKLAHLVRVFGRDLPMIDVTAKRIGQYLRTRSDEGAHPSSMNKELIALRQVLRYAQQRGEFQGDIAGIMPIGFDHEYDPRDTFLTPPEARLLLATMASKRKGIAPSGGLLHAARTAFFLATGARDSELGRARAEDVDLANWLVRLRGTKTKRSLRDVPIVLPECREFLVGALMTKPLKSGLLFGPWANAVRDLEKYCSLAGLHKVTPNDLRRSHAKWLRAQGVEPALIGSVLGHVDSRMVERVYGRLNPSELRDVLERRLVQNQLTDAHRDAQTGDKT